MMTDSSNLKKLFNYPGSVFLAGYLLLFPALFVLVLLYSKAEIHLAVNGLHNEFLDILMRYWTLFGDGLLLVVVAVLMLLISFRYFFTAITAFTFGGITVQLFKRLLFSDLPRPLKYFELLGRGDELYLVPGVDMHSWLSFPSGHTTTAFAVFFAIALLTRTKIAQAGLFLLALGVGYSRVYLSQHFLMDVVAGSFLGLLCGWMAWWWIRRYHAPWLDGSLSNLRIT